MKAQYSTVYGMLILALSFMVMIGIFVFSNQIRDVATKNLGERILDTVSDKISESLLDMKLLAGRTTANNLTVIVSVPDRVGEQNYFVRGENTSFVVRTMGRRSLVVETNISALWNVTILGVAFSQSGHIKLDYIPPSIVMLS